MPPQVKPRFYRDLLTPALHRRFTSAAGVTLALCYVEAVLIGEKSSLLWFWFPLGGAGVRTLLLFISCLSIFVLRVAQLHFGLRTTVSPFQTCLRYTFRFNTIQTLGWYFFSAWWFSEVYVWYAADHADLKWIAEGKSYERLRLNERPIYLRSVFFMLALLQSLFHLCYDYDRVILHITTTRPVSSPEQRPHIMVPPVVQLKSTMLVALKGTAVKSLFVGVLGPFIYALFLRRSAWNWSYYFAKLLWSLPKTSDLSYIPPFHISLIIRSITSGFLLVLLWESSNAIFGAYVAQEPLKRDHPLSDDSRDPNGSLLNGLKSRKEAPKTFAFWELVYISQRFEVRRKSIFSEIDRVGGPMWTQTLSACLNTIQGINKRIKDSQNPPSTAPLPLQQPTILQSLPRLSTPLRQDQTLTNPLPPTTRCGRIESTISTIAKHYGQSTPSQNENSSGPLSPRARKYLRAAQDKLLTEGQQQQISPASLSSIFNEYVSRFVHSPVGQLFRQTFKRRVCVVVLGSPYSDLSPIIDAIDSLTCLAMASLKEDTYGKVSKDVALMIRTFTSTIETLETFMAGLSAHWTDVEFDEQEKKVEEVEQILACLRGGVTELVKAFGEYAKELGMEEWEISWAKRLAWMEKAEEMVKA